MPCHYIIRPGTQHHSLTPHPASSFLACSLLLPHTLTIQRVVSKTHAEGSRCFMSRENVMMFLEGKGKAFILVITIQAAKPLKKGHNWVAASNGIIRLILLCRLFYSSLCATCIHHLIYLPRLTINLKMLLCQMKRNTNVTEKFQLNKKSKFKTTSSCGPLVCRHF